MSFVNATYLGIYVNVTLGLMQHKLNIIGNIIPMGGSIKFARQRIAP